MTDDKKHAEEKRYAVLSKESVQVFAEAIGHSDVSEEVFSILAEDATYRLREITQLSGQFMRHAKRRKLHVNDFNQALKTSDVQVVNGHGGPDPVLFRQTKEGELCFTDDNDMNLCGMACSSFVPPNQGQVTVKAQWLAVEGVPRPSPTDPVTQAKDGEKGSRQAISEELQQYYDHITQAILGQEEELMKLALSDLRSNTNICPVLPYFVSFVANGVKTVSHDIAQLTKLMHTARAIMNNKSLYLEPKPYLNLLVQGIVYCMVEPLAASINPLIDDDHWVVRDSAARLLACLTQAWTSPVNQLRRQNVQTLQDTLYDPAKPFCSHYGAIMGLIAFGTKAVEDIVLPHMASYWTPLQAAMEDNSIGNAHHKADAQKVYGALMLAAEYVIQSRTSKMLAEAEEMSGVEIEKFAVMEDRGKEQQQEEAEEMANMTSTPVKKQKPAASGSTNYTDGELVGTVLQLPEQSPQRVLSDIYHELYGYFGDGLAARLPIRMVSNFYSTALPEKCTLLEDKESQKSGEELLQAFLDVSSSAMTDHSASHEMKSENHSYDVMGRSDDEEPMDYEGDDKSEEKSERSFRSDRSHSDDNNTFFPENETMTVKTTVSDPSKGIKLTIKKVQLTSDKPDKQEKAKQESKRSRKRKDSHSKQKTHEVFEQVPLRKKWPLIGVGVLTLRPNIRQPSKLKFPPTGSIPVHSPMLKQYHKSKPFGKRPLGTTSFKDKQWQVYLSSANINCIL